MGAQNNICFKSVRPYAPMLIKDDVMARKKINLNFAKRNEDIYEFLKSLDEDISEYICRLVRADKENKDILTRILTKVENIEKKLDGKVLEDSGQNQDIWQIDDETESMILNEED